MAVAAMLCSVVLLTLYLLVSMALMAGYYYGPVELVAGPGCSLLFQANPLFVKEITVRMAEGYQGSGENGLVLYGLAGGPPRLDVPVAWSQARRVVVPANSHREWVYFLNRGSHIKVDYSVKPGTELVYPLCIVVARGNESFTRWTENPSAHDTTSSCRWAHGTGTGTGTGTVKHNIHCSGDYYVAVGNFNDQDTMVMLDVRVTAVLYDTAAADYACSPGSSRCTYRLPILGKNVAVLSSGLLRERLNSDDEQYVEVSYEPRWIVYFVGSGTIPSPAKHFASLVWFGWLAVLAVALLLLYEVLSGMLDFCGCCCCCTGGAPGAAEQRTATASLLAADKEEDASLGSSYDSVSNDEEMAGDEEERRLCVVCCDARRDCFFLPCGHSATCHPCGTRIVEGDGGTCPFCRRKLKKVRRIFAV